MAAKVKPGGDSKVTVDMTPMIDVVFQLLIFFMLTLKIKADEGDFGINMPLGQSTSVSTDTIPALKVRLVANPDGSLAALQYGRRNLGTGDRAFAELNYEVLKVIGRPGSPLSKEVEVELDPDYELNYAEVVKAMSAVSGRVDPATKLVVRYVENVKFAQPRGPKAGK